VVYIHDDAHSGDLYSIDTKESSSAIHDNSNNSCGESSTVYHKAPVHTVAAAVSKPPLKSCMSAAPKRRGVSTTARLYLAESPHPSKQVVIRSSSQRQQYAVKQSRLHHVSAASSVGRLCDIETGVTSDTSSAESDTEEQSVSEVQVPVDSE
jgi:hypothetical protein